ncbi:ABC transporter ATP-binding protein [Halopiger djelfimassiliensis]|uniref:ABC transporter ATP-binding protein n=1 Tax=Halopiger djelfimassiliensis TaxID=1293047 RepID=UPI000677EDCC|nr:ABC transporter ATP-binding protein [Halopiger djelfimassiliensis]
MSAITVENVSKRYGTVTALDRVDLTVDEGEIFGFLGPNGAGKSTLINVFLDFTQPDSGQATIFGHDCQEDDVEVKSRMGVLPDGYSVYDRLTGRQHMEYAIEAKAADAEPMAVLERVGIRDAADQKAGGYSKGMAQRLVLGMALVGEPDLLILDEPTSGLDPHGIKQIRTVIREENERGATVFFSSHILEQVEAVCDRVGILYDGQVVATDTIDGLRQSVGGGTKLLITVDDLETDVVGRLESLDGVENVWPNPDENRIEVTCTNDAKMTVLVALHEAGVDVENFRTEEASLEEMFVEYTNGVN